VIHCFLCLCHTGTRTWICRLTTQMGRSSWVVILCIILIGTYSFLWRAEIVVRNSDYPCSCLDGCIDNWSY